ncbi:hypothetical protein ENKNEFLB_03904 [Nocardioides aquaticus]|uniref:PLD phosphodiesterase domain-containing protein n=1 Tax=Nocardioides aquaticus TaxID=160826 RepID=A0ABX8ELT7_9ACTN|nr:phospholipase D family protein [Nocardioides aquaticus]QVT81494.1 hypothetical protein ENKNEFLB_03904 [Nocardioides aquaticus]
MLNPENRHLLTDALRPPSGFTVDVALATTYTLDLHSLLLAPLAMAAYDHTSAETPDAATPVALLESIRRHAEHTTVLCQAAGIHVPGTYHRLAAFAEGMVAEVVPPTGGTFHPKIWVIRFIDVDGTRRHRFACLSRNLTGDRSWDTVLVCEEDPATEAQLDPQPVATFVRELLGSLVRPLSPERQAQVLDLCDSLAGAPLAVPSPFTAARAVPLGTPSGDSWPLPERASRLAVISPFLESSALGRLPKTDGRSILLSRTETFERVGRDACGDAETLVLQAMADVVSAEEDPADAVNTDRATSGPPPRGLHAKVFAWEEGRTSHLLTGSANCTAAAFGANIEMSVLLSGSKAVCGIDAVLGDAKTGLLALTQPHEIVEADGVEDSTYVVERRIEQWHAALASRCPTLSAETTGDDFCLKLDVNLPADPHGLAKSTTVRPVASKNSPARPLGSDLSWRNVSLHGLSPYLVVSTTAGVDGFPLVRECVILCEMVGAPGDRLRRLLRDLLSRQQDVLRYLALLLGDVGASDLLDRLLADDDPDDPDDQADGGFRPGFHDLVLLEPLVKAAARNDDALVRAHRLLDDLRDSEGNLTQLDEDFLHLWQVVWEAAQR